MPLRDHYCPPISNRFSWEGFHGGFPACIVLQLAQVMPEHFTAEPRIHLGTYYAFEEDDKAISPSPSKTTGMTDSELTDQYAYEVLVYDQNQGRQLVAAVEIVSPANKDRPENRQAFVTKCAALLQKRVCVSIVDLVTTRQFNLYADLLELIRRSDPAFTPKAPPIYAVTCRWRNIGNKSRFETWAHPLLVGQPLPELPLWLSDDLFVSLDLETSYEKTCRALRIA